MLSYLRWLVGPEDIPLSYLPTVLQASIHQNDLRGLRFSRLDAIDELEDVLISWFTLTRNRSESQRKHIPTSLYSAACTALFLDQLHTVAV